MTTDNARLIWMRHGTCYDGVQEPTIHARPDSPLTALGRVEALAAADRLAAAGLRPAVVVSSPLPRAAATAAIVASQLGVTLGEPHPLFAEWAAPYCVRGLGPAEYPPEYLDWQRRRTSEPDLALPGGESLHALHQRAVAARTHAYKLADRFSRVLVVSHKVLIGSVAVLDQDVSDPVTAFEFARAFPLPAGRYVATTARSA